MSQVTRDEAREKAVWKINEVLGSDYKNLSKIEGIFEEISSKKRDLERQLSLTDESSKVLQTTRAIDEVCNEITGRIEEIDAALEKIRLWTEETSPAYDTLKEPFEEIAKMKNIHSYLRVLEFIQQTGGKIEGYVVARDSHFERAIDEYRKLCEMCCQLEKTSCHALKTYLFGTAKFWHKILRAQISDEFTLSMKNVNWPIVTSNSLLTAPSNDAMTKFQIGVKRLLQIQLPPEVEEKHVVSSSLAINFPQPSLPTLLLLQPLRKRFLYHFSGNNRTNRIDKPEWYFTQILTWIRDHESFILNWVQPVYEDFGLKQSALVEFMCGLVELAIEKLQADVEQAQYDDTHFSHLVDETLGFERELRHSYFYPQGLPGPIQVMTQAPLFVKWINMERTYAKDKMVALMSSDTAWCYSIESGDEDKVTEVAKGFLALLTTMTERCSLLPQPGHRLQFIELELELIDDLRVSFLQVLSSEDSDPLNSKHAQILNTVTYVREAIEHYDSSPNILLLDHYRKQFNVPSESKTKVQDEDEGLFEPSVKLLKRLESNLLETLCEALLMEVKARSRSYRKDRWFAMSENDLDPTCVTQSACPMFQTLADKLHCVEATLSNKVFSSFWTLVASGLNSFFIEELVLSNHFNSIGGQVLQKDINKFLLPLFHHYSKSPKIYFAQVLECCSLLALPSLPPLVEKAAITGEKRDLLVSLPVPVKSLNVDRVVIVLRQRMDISAALL